MWDAPSQGKEYTASFNTEASSGSLNAVELESRTKSFPGKVSKGSSSVGRRIGIGSEVYKRMGYVHGGWEPC